MDYYYFGKFIKISFLSNSFITCTKYLIAKLHYIELYLLFNRKHVRNTKYKHGIIFIFKKKSYHLDKKNDIISSSTTRLNSITRSSCLSFKRATIFYSKGRIFYKKHMIECNTGVPLVLIKYQFRSWLLPQEVQSGLIDER